MTLLPNVSSKKMFIVKNQESALKSFFQPDIKKNIYHYFWFIKKYILFFRPNILLAISNFES